MWLRHVDPPTGGGTSHYKWKTLYVRPFIPQGDAIRLTKFNIAMANKLRKFFQAIT